MIFRVGAERSSRRSVHKVHDCGENREGNNPENSAVKGIVPKKPRTGVQVAWRLIKRFNLPIRY
ncbi:MAG: hypothetical protein U1E78_08600 [Gammaproteobacteria bacterium]